MKSIINKAVRATRLAVYNFNLRRVNRQWRAKQEYGR